MENKQKNPRRRLNSLILLVAFTAVMLIVSTYAWFSAQKNVTLGGLTGIVKVAEGLEVSLDAEHWSQEIDFANYTADELKRQYGVDADGNLTGHTHYDRDIVATDVDHNIVPSELQPVSTTGKSGDGIGQTDMNMYRGILKTSGTKSSANGIQSDLSEVITVKKGTNATTYTEYDENSSTTQVAPQHHDYPGYYAIDVFLKNSTRRTDSGTTNFSEIIQLNTNSKLELLSNDNKATGLQNTVRVAFAVYKAATGEGTTPTIPGTVTNEEDKIAYWDAYVASAACTASNYMNAPADKILAAYKGQTINDVAIWEPNASDHVDYIYDIVEQYDDTQYPRFSLDDTKLFIDSSATTGRKGMEWKTSDGQTPPTYTEHKVGAMRTYALSSSVVSKAVTNIYDWATPSTGLAAQVTLQTEKTSESNYAIKDGVKNLVSVTSDPRLKYVLGNETGEVAAAAGGTETATVTNLKMQDGAVAKLRMYVWLEGQDVDTINHASHGGGIDLDVGLLKDGVAGQS